MSVAHWDLQIPVRVTLSADEISSPTAVSPVYLLAPRQGYLAPLGLQALPFFQHVLPAVPGSSGVKQPTPWLEYHGLPLKWSTPVGVLHDLIAGQHELPWDLTVHFHNPPASLLAWENNISPREHFFNSLKEASYICKGSEGSGAVMRMSSSAQDALWQAVSNGQGPGIDQALAALKVVPAQRQGQGPFIPIRAFIRQHRRSAEDAGVLSLWEATSTTSRPVDAAQADGSPTQLWQAIQLIAPALFPTAAAPAEQSGALAGEASSSSSSSAAPGQAQASTPVPEEQQEAASAEAQAAVVDPLGAGPVSVRQAPPAAPEREAAAAQGSAGPTGGAAAGPGLPAGMRVVVAGVQPSPHAPIAWLHGHLRSPDNFLYLVVHCKQP